MEERELIERWVETWKRAGPEIEAIHRREIRETDNLKVLALLEGAFTHALRTLPPDPPRAWSKCRRGFGSCANDRAV
jgi:hypothetical protein